MPRNIVPDLDTIAAICQSHAVRRLFVFGSALTDRFDETRSDVDFLVEFEPDVDSYFEAYFGLKETLEDIVGRPVDLVTSNMLQNPYFAESVRQSAEELYAA